MSVPPKDLQIMRNCPIQDIYRPPQSFFLQKSIVRSVRQPSYFYKAEQISSG